MTEPTTRSRWGIDGPSIDEATAKALNATYVERDSHRSGRHDARHSAIGVAVRALIGYLRGDTVTETAAADEIPDEAMLAAIADHHRHRELIGAKLLLQDEAFV